MGAGADGAAEVVQVAVDLNGFRGAAHDFVLAAIEGDIAGPFAADDMVLPFGAENARLGHQDDGVGVGHRAVAAGDFEAGRAAEDVRLMKAELHGLAKQNFFAVGKKHGLSDPLPSC